MIIVILIIGNAILIYYMLNSSEYMSKFENNNSEENVVKENENVDTIANILNTVVSNTVNSGNSTVLPSGVNSRNITNENLIVLYNGRILDTTKMDEVNLNYIDNNSLDKDKYVITYYNYENFAYRDSTLGKLTDQIYDNAVAIENVGKIAVSEEYNAITGEMKITNALPTVVSENNNLNEFDTVKTISADLDSNGAEEYVIILANKVTGFSKIALYDLAGKKVADLAYIEKSKWDQNSDIEYYLSLDNVNILDVDNDGVMEILIEIPKYEGDPSVSILKYKNSELSGKTNIECSLLP